MKRLFLGVHKFSGILIKSQYHACICEVNIMIITIVIPHSIIVYIDYTVILVDGRFGHGQFGLGQFGLGQFGLGRFGLGRFGLAFFQSRTIRTYHFLGVNNN